MDAVEKLQKEHEKILEDIYTVAEKKAGASKKLAPITDGIYDAKKYLESPVKIMWILKEPYDDFDKKGNPVGGDWDLPAFLFEDPEKFATEKSLGRKLTYVNYAIINGKSWEEMDYTTDNPEMGKVNQQIAYINVSKMPAKKTSNDSDLFVKYGIWKDILWKQIETYNPDVIIFGNTFGFFEDGFGENVKPFKEEDWDGLTNAYMLEDKLLLWAYHPSYYGVTDGDYVESIITAYNSWKKYKDSLAETYDDKYDFILKVAKFLCENNLRMSGQGLAELLNTNGFHTAYETPYSGGRGTYTLIRCCWDYFNNNGKEKEREFIEKAFVKANGDYAYQ